MSEKQSNIATIIAAVIIVIIGSFWYEGRGWPSWKQDIYNYHDDVGCSSHINGLVQERRNAIANALDLRLSCTNPLIAELSQCRASWPNTVLVKKGPFCLNLLWCQFDIKYSLKLQKKKRFPKLHTYIP